MVLIKSRKMCERCGWDTFIVFPRRDDDLVYPEGIRYQNSYWWCYRCVNPHVWDAVYEEDLIPVGSTPEGDEIYAVKWMEERYKLWHKKEVTK